MDQILDISKYSSLALPAKSMLFFPVDLARRGYKYILIKNVKEINTSYIIYDAICYYLNDEDEERIFVLEDFQVIKDRRGNDGMLRIRGEQSESDAPSHGFVDYIIKDSFDGKSWMIRQICEFYGDEYGLSPAFLLANDTRYYIPLSNNTQFLNKSFSPIFQRRYRPWLYSDKLDILGAKDLPCPKCGFPCPKDSQRCINCGAKMDITQLTKSKYKSSSITSTMLLCPKCGFSCSPSSAKCPKCGEKLPGRQKIIPKEVVEKWCKYILEKGIEIIIICCIVKFILT